MSFLRVGQRFVYENISRRYAHVISDGRGRCHEHFNSRFEINVENPESEQKLNRSTLTKYEFPEFCLKYSSADVVQHNASLGVGEWLISAKSKIQVPPSFVLVFSNFIMLALSKRDIMLKDRTVHAEQSIDIIRPLKPEGIISYKLIAAEVINKGKGTVFTFDFHGRDEDEKEIFFLQKKFYEINLTAGKKRSNAVSAKKRSDESSTRNTDVPTKMEPDQIFEFKTNPFNPTLFFNPTPNDLKESIFSPNHWRQYHDITKHFKTEPNCHGRYYLGAATSQILNHFANGDATLFKRVQSRFTHAVFAEDTLITKSWKIKDRVHFETFAKETGKRVLEGFLDLNN